MVLENRRVRSHVPEDSPMTSEFVESRWRARLMLVDDHDLVRRGVRSLIENIPDWTVCAEAPETDEALKLAAATKPDIVVTEISQAYRNGTYMLESLKKILPQSEILVLTGNKCERSVVYAMRSGVTGFVLKNEGVRSIIEALSALSRHRPYFSSSVSENLLKFCLRPNHADNEQLTRRERQIAKLVAEGNTNQRITEILKISIKTVETHRAAVLQKIGAKSAAEIALYAARNELVHL
jgi:DNA-binding NarL/FixJ family response regulator